LEAKLGRLFIKNRKEEANANERGDVRSSLRC